MQKLTFFLILLFSTSYISAQQHYLLSNFSGFKDENRVVLNWTIKRGSSCIGIGILRSTDDLNYEVVGEIRGVCGSTEFAQNYNFIDIAPVRNSKNYYKLELGFSGRTEPAVIIEFIDISGTGYKLIPSPVTSNSKLYFDNSNNSSHTLKLYTSTGHLWNQTESSEDFFEIITPQSEQSIFDQSSFISNIYFFRIEDAFGNLKSQGKFFMFKQDLDIYW